MSSWPARSSTPWTSTSLIPDSIRVIAEHRAEQPVEFFSLAGRPTLQAVRVETTNVSAYGELLTEVVS